MYSYGVYIPMVGTNVENHLKASLQIVYLLAGSEGKSVNVRNANQSDKSAFNV